MRPNPIIVALVAVLLTAGASGQFFLYADFSSLANLTLNGNAGGVGTVLRVTPNVGGQLGTVYHDTPQPVIAGFDTNFNFQISPSGGADGMGFILQGDPVQGINAIGGTGGQLAYGLGQSFPAANQPISNSLVIEIDTYVNGHPGGADLGVDEISVHTNGAGPNSEYETFSIGSVLSPVPLSDGLMHNMRIFYTPGTLEIYIDFGATPVLTVPWDFTTGGAFLLSGNPVGGLNLINGSDLYVGFCSGTGGLTADHDVLSWQWQSTSLPACWAGNVGASGGGPYDILTVNGSTGGFLRTVEVYTHDPITVSIANPPTSTMPSNFVIFGMTQFPVTSDMWTLPFGTMCFPPWVVFPIAPLFILTDNFSANPFDLVNSFPAPWSFTFAPGVTFPFQASLQAVIAEQPGMLSISNTVLLDIVLGPPPTITGFSPGAANVGTNVSIQGSGFRSGLVLDVGGTSVVPTNVANTQVDFIVPAGAGCDTPVTITNPDGQTAMGNFNPTPVVLTTVLGQGPVAGGQNFVMVGSGFTAGTTVTIDGNPATIVTQSATSIVVTTPPGAAPGAVNVVITSLTGCSTTTTYTYL